MALTKKLAGALVKGAGKTIADKCAENGIADLAKSVGTKLLDQEFAADVAHAALGDGIVGNIVAGAVGGAIGGVTESIPFERPKIGTSPTESNAGATE